MEGRRRRLTTCPDLDVGSGRFGRLLRTAPMLIEPSKGRSRPRTRRSELERLVDCTVLEPTHPQLGTCWRFTGTTTPYGRIAKAQDSYTHRLGWKLLRGPIPEGKELHHRCGVHACWNPDHLEPGDPRRESMAPSQGRNANTATRYRVRTSGSTRGRRRESSGACLREGQRQLRAAAKRRQPSDLGPPGRPGRPRGGLGRTADLERLLDRTVLGQTHPTLGTCWLFTGPANPYGRLGKGPERSTHRLGWKWLRGPIPDGLELHHLCGVHVCWNPDHLVVVSQRQRVVAFTATDTPASADIRCRVRTFGSIRAQARGSAEHAPRLTRRAFRERKTAKG